MKDERLPLPGLPIPDPYLSFWQRSTRQWTLLHEGSTSELPRTADVIVIGSGLSGALTAFELLSSSNGPKNVVMLEAREACSGATSRNAGHCRPDAFRGFSTYAKIHGPEQAMKILAHEKLVLQLIKEFVEKHGVDCDFDYCRTFDVIMSEDFRRYETESFGAYEKAGGDTSDIVWLEAEEAKRITRVPAALGAVEWTAASLHPAKLCQAILNLSKELGLSLFTHTPVTSVSPSETTHGHWVVKTARGCIEAPIVVHATNAFAATLLPQLSKLITPMRGQAQKLTPTRPFSGPSLLTHTYSLRFGLSHFYSVIQRKSDGVLVLGNSKEFPGMSEQTRVEIVGSTDERVHNEEIKQNALQNFRDVFVEWGEESQGEGYEYGWTGVLAITTDSVPYIGPIPSLPGQFVIAGFNGHGMARIFGCAPGLSQMILGGEWSDTTMPECFQITRERMERAVI